MWTSLPMTLRLEKNNVFHLQLHGVSSLPLLFFFCDLKSQSYESLKWVIPFWTVDVVLLFKE